MNEDRDPWLAGRFGQAEPPPDAAAFVARFERRLLRARRVRTATRIVMAAALALVAWGLSPLAISASVWFGQGVADFMRSPGGWALSMGVGAWVLLRIRGSLAR